MRPVGDWRIKIGGGVSRRSNSANPATPGAALDDSQLEAVVAAYAEVGLPAYVRLPSLLHHNVDGFLAERGFAREGSTLTLTASLDGADAVSDVELTAEPTPQWLQASNAINQRPPAEARAFEAILGRLQASAAFAAVRREDRLVAVSYGVRHGRWLCLEAVAADPAWRGRGLAGKTVAALMAWGAGQGAFQAALQVSEDNAPARALYARLGFDRELYRYHYRRAPAA